MRNKIKRLVIIAFAFIMSLTFFNFNSFVFAKNQEQEDTAKTLHYDYNFTDKSKYTCYGAENAYVKYNQATKSVDVLAHSGYANGFTISDTDAVIAVEMSVDVSSSDNWMGIGLLDGKEHGYTSTTHNGVMLYITKNADKYAFRIFKMPGTIEQNTYVSNVAAGEKFTLKYQYDQNSSQWFYYINDTKIYNDQNYLDGVDNTDESNKTYLNFAYNDVNPIKIYAVYYFDSSIEKEEKGINDTDFVNKSNYSFYGGQEAYINYNEDTSSLDIMAHSAYKNGFKVSDTQANVTIELSVDVTSADNWMGIGLLNGQEHGYPGTTESGIMLYITNNNGYYCFRIFKMPEVQEFASYVSNIGVGQKFFLSFKYDQEKANWFYYINGVRIFNGQNYFDNVDYKDEKNFTYLNFAYNDSVPIKLYSINYFDNAYIEVELPELYTDVTFQDVSLYTNYGLGNNYVTYNADTDSVDILAHSAYHTGFRISDTNAVISVKMSVELTSPDNWMGIGLLDGNDHGYTTTSHNGIMLYMTVNNGYYAFRIFKMPGTIEQKTFVSDVEVGEVFDLTYRYDPLYESWFYFINGKRIFAGQYYMDNVDFTDDNNLTYLNFAYNDVNPIKVYSIDTYDTIGTVNYSITNATGGFAFLPANVTLGEDLDLSGIYIKKVTSRGVLEYIPLTLAMLSGYDKNATGEEALGDVTVTITYEDVVVKTFNVLVKDKVVDVEFTAPSNSKKYYAGYSTELDLSNGTLKEKYQSGKENIVSLTKSMVSQVDFSTAGEKTVTVSYQGQTFTYTITVLEDSIVSIAIDDQNAKTQYYVGEALDLTNVNVLVTYTSGKTETFSVQDEMFELEGFDSSKAGDITLTVSLKDNGEINTTLELSIVSKPKSKGCKASNSIALFTLICVAAFIAQKIR